MREVEERDEKNTKVGNHILKQNTHSIVLQKEWLMILPLHLLDGSYASWPSAFNSCLYCFSSIREY